MGVLTHTHTSPLTHTHTHTHITPHTSIYISIPHKHPHLSTSVGNKNDCPEKKVVQTEDAHKFADQIGIELYETSAKENINVEEVRGNAAVVKICVHVKSVNS